MSMDAQDQMLWYTLQLSFFLLFSALITTHTPLPMAAAGTYGTYRAIIHLCHFYRQPDWVNDPHTHTHTSKLEYMSHRHVFSPLPDAGIFTCIHTFVNYTTRCTERYTHIHTSAERKRKKEKVSEKERERTTSGGNKSLKAISGKKAAQCLFIGAQIIITGQVEHRSAEHGKRALPWQLLLHLLLQHFFIFFFSNLVEFVLLNPQRKKKVNFSILDIFRVSNTNHQM